MKVADAQRRRFQPKHQQVYQALQREIQSGRLKRGDRLPSEAELVRTFGASRITVGRAVRDLQIAGLVERRVGSGTYVRGAGREPRKSDALSFGLLIPERGETEIFEPICQGMMASPLAIEHALVWGSDLGPGASKADRAWHLCRQYIERDVAGVFFAPLELTPDKDDTNKRIAEALDTAGIPIILLDRTVLPYPQRGRHDLVGIDNRRAGFLVTEHLLRQGSRQIAFVADRHAAATVDAREAGYREALYAWNVPIDRGRIHRLDPAETTDVRALVHGDRAGRRDRLRERLDGGPPDAHAAAARGDRPQRHPRGGDRRRGLRGAAAGAADDIASAGAGTGRGGHRGHARPRGPAGSADPRHPAARHAHHPRLLRGR